MKASVDDNIILYALRYSLSRETNAPAIVMNNIIKNIDSISIENIKKIINEIECSNDIGYSIYKDTWDGLVEDLKFELKIRELKN